MRFTYEDLVRGCTAFVEKEDDDSYYRRAARVIEERYGQTEAMKDAISALLNIWHRGFYRFGDFSREALQNCIAVNLPKLSEYRVLNLRDIDLTDGQFEGETKEIFRQFLNALAGENRKFVRRSPVAVAKALNLLAPTLFPLWDRWISMEYNCWWGNDTDYSYSDYYNFMGVMQRCCLDLVEEYQTRNKILDAPTAESVLINACLNTSGAGYSKTLLKLVDEYNYAKFTKEWI